MKKITTVIAGIGGYGNKILKNTLPNLEDWGMELVAVVDPNRQAAPMWQELETMGIPGYDSLEAFYAQHRADLAILCTPIQFHRDQAILAMENGSHVFCEKPTAATLTQSEEMEQVAKKTARHLQIGFQLSYVPALWQLKQDIMDGLLGAPKTLSALVSWPRNGDYYARSWCAKVKWQGRYVLDSIAMNACAHYLHILYFLLGDRMDAAAMPEKGQALLLRANPIETFDTAMLRVQAGGATVNFLATHTGRRKIDPTMVLQFENARVEISETDEENAVCARFSDGTVKNYGAIKRDFYNKIPHACRVIRGEAAPVCTPATAKAHLKTVNAITELVPVQTVTDTCLENGFAILEGMDELLETAFSQGKMPWELTDRYGMPTELDFTNYTWRDLL